MGTPLKTTAHRSIDEVGISQRKASLCPKDIENASKCSFLNGAQASKWFMRLWTLCSKPNFQHQ